MLTKEEFTKTHPELRMGMKVYARNNEKLGEIEDLTDQGLVIGKGWLLPKFFTIPYDDIMEIRGNRVILNKESSDIEGGRRDESEERAGYETEEVRIPVREEEPQAEKRTREGEVRIRKDVHTETEHMEVPVQKEDVVVEHVPVEEGREEEFRGEAFSEEEARIPVREEEVEVSKRPVVKEEVRARKETRTEPEEVSGEVRKENVRVERSDSSEKKDER